MNNLSATIQEIQFLTKADKGKLQNGLPDPGFNCFENAFMTMYLLRMHGYNVHLYTGRMIVVDKPNKTIFDIVPHAWTGSPEFGVVDFSLDDFNAIPSLHVYRNKIVNRNNWDVNITLKVSDYQKIKNKPSLIRGDKFLLYLLDKKRPFNLPDIFCGPKATTSPKTVDRFSCYNDDLLAKLAVHIYLHSKGEKTSVAAYTQPVALKMIDEWDIEPRHYIH